MQHDRDKNTVRSPSIVAHPIIVFVGCFPKMLLLSTYFLARAGLSQLVSRLSFKLFVICFRSIISSYYYVRRRSKSLVGINCFKLAITITKNVVQSGETK